MIYTIYTYPFPKKDVKIPMPDKVLKIVGIPFNQPAYIFIAKICEHEKIKNIYSYFRSDTPLGTCIEGRSMPYWSYQVELENFIKKSTKWGLEILTTTPMSNMVNVVRIKQKDNGVNINWEELINLLSQKYGETAKKGDIKMSRRSRNYWGENNYTIVQPGHFKMDDFTQRILGANGRTGGVEDIIIKDKVFKGITTYSGYLIKNQYIEIFVSPTDKMLVYTDLQISKINERELIELQKYAKELDDKRIADEEAKRKTAEEAERKRIEAIEAEKRNKKQERINKILGDI